MKNAEFKNAVDYSNALINLCSGMIEKKISPNVCGMVLSEVCEPTIKKLTGVASKIDVDDHTIDVLDGLEDADYQLPDAVAIEYTRRTREMVKLRVRMRQACVHEVEAESFDELSGILRRLMSPSEGIVMKDTLTVSKDLLGLYEDWHEVDMGEFGRALSILLAVGKFAAEVVAKYFDEDEKDEEDLGDSAIDLLDAFDDECESFLERYPDMEGCFDVDEDDERDDEDDEYDDEYDDEGDGCDQYDDCDGDCDHCNRGPFVF